MKKAIASLLVLSTVLLGTTVPAPESAHAATAVPYNATYGLKIVEAAKSLIGKVSYENAYDPANLRIDCSGFTYEVFKRAGINLASIDDDEQAKLGEYVPREELQPGDLVFFWNSMSVDKNDVGHVGIYIGNGKYIHNSDPTYDVVISDFNSSFATSHYITARRVYPVAKPAIATPATTQNIADLALSMKETAKWAWTYSPSTMTFNAPAFATYVYQQAGVNLGLTSSQAVQATELYKKGTSVDFADLQKGDLVFFGASATDHTKVTYVGIYLGNGMFIHAYGPAMPILISDINKDSYKGRYMGAKRILATETPAPAPTPTPEPTPAPTPAPVTSAQVVTAAKNLLGKVQYSSTATYSPSKLTFNAPGYVYYSYLQAGYDLKTRNVTEMAKLGTAVSKVNMKPGDLIFFWTTTKGVAGHVGIYLGNGMYIQNPDSTQDVCIKSINRDYVTTHFLTARRILAN